MTCNQLMILLDVYRGSDDSMCGTFRQDMAYLVSLRLVRKKPGGEPINCRGLQVTPRGREFVDVLLAMGGLL